MRCIAAAQRISKRAGRRHRVVYVQSWKPGAESSVEVLAPGLGLMSVFCCVVPGVTGYMKSFPLNGFLINSWFVICGAFIISVTVSPVWRQGVFTAIHAVKTHTLAGANVGKPDNSRVRDHCDISAVRAVLYLMREISQILSIEATFSYLPTCQPD
jgi:hypothetical protein